MPVEVGAGAVVLHGAGAVPLTMWSSGGISNPGTRTGVVCKECYTGRVVISQHKGINHKFQGNFLGRDVPSSGSSRRGQSVVTL